MADPLSVAASIAGLFSLAGQLLKVVGPYVSATIEGVPPIAREVHSELQSTQTILRALYELIDRVDERNLENESLIRVDHLSAVLTDGVMILSEFSKVIGTTTEPDEHAARLRLKSRLEWAWKESSLVPLLGRLQGFKSSVSTMLAILQSDSFMKATKEQARLVAEITRLVQGSKLIQDRLQHLERALSVREGTASLRTHAALDDDTSHEADKFVIENPGNKTKSPDESEHLSSTGKENGTFEAILQLSRVYRSIRGNEVDPLDTRQSIMSTPWSVCSTSSLAEISNISVFAIPIYPRDFGAGTSAEDSQAWQDTMDLEVKRRILREKILAIGRMSRVFDILKEEEMEARGG